MQVSDSCLGCRGTSSSVGGYFNVLGVSDLEMQPRQFDIDPVTIMQAPEPGVLLTAAITCGMLLARRRGAAASCRHPSHRIALPLPERGPGRCRGIPLVADLDECLAAPGACVGHGRNLEVVGRGDPLAFFSLSCSQLLTTMRFSRSSAPRRSLRAGSRSMTTPSSSAGSAT